MNIKDSSSVWVTWQIEIIVSLYSLSQILFFVTFWSYHLLNILHGEPFYSLSRVQSFSILLGFEEHVKCTYFLSIQIQDLTLNNDLEELLLRNTGWKALF